MAVTRTSRGVPSTEASLAMFQLDSASDPSLVIAIVRGDESAPEVSRRPGRLRAALGDEALGDEMGSAWADR